MRPHAVVAALLLAAFAAAPAQAHHNALGCVASGFGFFTALNPLGCGMPVTCPAGGGTCSYTLHVEASGNGAVSARGEVGGQEVAACGPGLFQCAGSAPFTVAEGATVFVECTSTELTATWLLDVVCAPEPAH